MKLILFTLSVLNLSIAHARPSVSDIVSFSSQEKQAMIDFAEDISENARNCLIHTYQENIDFHSNVQSVDGSSLGTRYGDQLHSRSQNNVIDQILNEIFSYDAVQAKRALVYQNALEVQDFLETQGMVKVPLSRVASTAKRFMKNKKDGTSCVTLARDCIREALDKIQNASLDSANAKIMREFSRSKAMGTVFMNLLQLAGWKVYYWNPDTSRNYEFDLFERYYQPPFSDNTGYHRYIYQKITRSEQQGQKGKYLEVNYNRHVNGAKSLVRHTVIVDDSRTLTNFGAATPQFLKDEPFYMGIAHMGFHVFLGSYGEVIEGHSKRPISDDSLLERSEFNPLNDGIDYFRLLVTDYDKAFLRRSKRGVPRMPYRSEYEKACQSLGLSQRACELRIERDKEVRLHQISHAIDHIGGPRPFTSKKYLDDKGNYLKYYRYRSGLIIVPPKR